MQDRGVKKNSLSTFQTNIISFYQWARFNDKILSNPIKGLQKIKEDARIPIYLTREEWIQLRDTAIDERDNLIIKVLYSTGVRVSELVSIKKADIDFKTGDIKVFGKGSKERVVNIPSPYVLDRLMKYTAEFDSEQRVFELTTSTVERTLRELRARAELKKKVTPHKLRHSFATHMLQSGGNIVNIQQLLGHSSLNTTQKYTHTTMEAKRNDLQNSPMSKEM
jgi:site-specific recombinase XerD